MQVLSLDLSTHSSGWAYFQDGELLDYGCITSSSKDLIKRIHIMAAAIKELIEKYKITKIIAEEVRPDLGKGNLTTHRALMYLQAALEFTVHDNFLENKIEIQYIYPSSWRALCGIKNGRGIKREEEKKYDIQFVKETYNINVNDDIADAIAIGYSQVKRDELEYNWE